MLEVLDEETAKIRAEFRPGADASYSPASHTFPPDAGECFRATAPVVRPPPEPSTLYRCFGNVTGAYRIDAVSIRARAVVTNKAPTGLNRVPSVEEKGDLGGAGPVAEPANGGLEGSAVWICDGVHHEPEPFECRGHTIRIVERVAQRRNGLVGAGPHYQRDSRLAGAGRQREDERHPKRAQCGKAAHTRECTGNEGQERLHPRAQGRLEKPWRFPV